MVNTNYNFQNLWRSEEVDFMLDFNGRCSTASLQILMKMRKEDIMLTKTQILQHEEKQKDYTRS